MQGCKRVDRSAALQIRPFCCPRPAAHHQHLLQHLQTSWGAILLHPANAAAPTEPLALLLAPFLMHTHQHLLKQEPELGSQQYNNSTRPCCHSHLMSHCRPAAADTAAAAAADTAAAAAAAGGCRGQLLLCCVRCRRRRLRRRCQSCHRLWPLSSSCSCCLCCCSSCCRRREGRLHL